MMEAAQLDHKSPLLPTTNALLDTTDLYHSLTVPLLDIVNRTKLISSRCGTTTLEPHLLSFLTNNLAGPSHQVTLTSTTTTVSGSDSVLVDTTATAEKKVNDEAMFKRSRPYRYLIALVLQDSEAILPDILTRILETISILGPDNCHLSIVDHASTDTTKTMLHKLKDFLDMYNRGDAQLLGQSDVAHPSDDGNIHIQGHRQGKNRQSLSYTITTMTRRDISVENLARIKDLALDPLLSTASASDIAVSINNSNDKEAFDRIILLDPMVTCAQDILELIFQSLMQDADVTCGMDLSYSTDTTGNDANIDDTDSGNGKLQVGIYDSTITRDMLHQRLHRDANHITQFSHDEETQSRFTKRVPFQVESCWSRAVVLRVSASQKLSNVTSGTSGLFSKILESHGALPQPRQLDQQENTNEEEMDQCITTNAMRDDRTLFCSDLWATTSSSSSTPVLAGAEESANSITRMVVVPSIQFTDSPKEYALGGKFNGWGLWPKTEKQYRDDLEKRLVSASHRPLYGYRPSISKYGYTPRVEEEDGVSSGSLLEVVFSHEQTQEELEEARTRKQEIEKMMSEVLPEETVEELKSRLEDLGAVFGVQDIQNAVLAKHDSDLITVWRPKMPVNDGSVVSIDC
ncbi:capsular associated protein [Linnemannia zychae]|nr:capsular associated protein [Linnemannia zychae]